MISARLLLLTFLVALAAIVPTRSTAGTLVRNNDTWVCLGDSITAENCYPVVLGEVFKHFHPNATLTVINSGQGGDTASDDPQKLAKRVLQYNPTVVSIMYGMNECMNAWHPGLPQQPILDHYRASLTYMVDTLRDKGITVILMSPTLTDPSCHSFFTLDKTIPMLHKCTTIVHEVADKEGAIYAPVQEDFEALQDSSPGGVILRPDGVHPSALGQYRMAQTLWERAGFSTDLETGKRTSSDPPPAAPIDVALDARVAPPGSTGIPMTITSATAQTIDISYNVGDVRGKASVDLPVGATKWTMPVGAAQMPATDGAARTAVMDIRAGKADSVYLIDLCQTAVLHLVNDTVSGTVNSADGTRVAGWKATRLGDDMLFDFDVADATIDTESTFPFGRDGLNLMFDFRPTDHFADIGVDRQVYQAFLTVREKPFFAVNMLMWTGLGLDYASTVAGERTPTGYTAHMLVHGLFNLHTPLDLKGRDYIGFLTAVDDENSAGKLTITTGQKNDGPVNLYANNLPIIDLKNAIPTSSIINVALYSAR